MDLSNLTIVIPCYNEEESIEDLLKKLAQFTSENNSKVIIVNDGSKDKSSQIISQYTNNNINIISHKINKGYGAAIKTGIINCKTDYVITIDADGQHNLSDVENLYQIMTEKDADLIIGSRVNHKDASFYRATGKWIIRKLTRVLIETTIYDMNSGMKIYQAKLAQKYLFLCPDGMAFSDIIALTFLSRRHVVLEESISLNKRTGGISTVNYKTAFNTVIEILNIVMLFNPLKIFIPSSFISFSLGLAWGIQFLVAGKGMSVFSSFLILLSFLTFSLGLLAEQLAQIRKEKIK